MSKAIDVTKNDFKSAVLESDLPVLVDFWAPWCGPCRMMAPVLDQLAETMAGEIKVVKVNTEEPENYELSEIFDIQSIPNLKLFKGGKVIAEFIGLRDGNTLKKEIKAFI